MFGKNFVSKTKGFILGNALYILAAAVVFTIGSGGLGSIGMVQGETPSYSIVFETSKNKLAIGAIKPTGYSGNGTALTELGNEVAFDYSLLVNPTSNWQTILAGGYITNTQPITGMESITLTKNSSSANFKIYWSNTTTFVEDRSVLFDTNSAMTVSTNFSGYMPNYIKLLAIDNSPILSASIAFSCINEYSTIDVTSENESMGSVSGGGIYHSGTEVAISAYPLSGYSFVGWFNGETLVSSSNPFTFLMPYNDLSYVAKFSANSYNLTLISNDTNKGTVSGGGTYAYGAEVTATATEISGNEFIGWYQSTTLKSTNHIYTFTMPFNDLSLEARFVTQYNVDISSISDASLGTVSGGGAHGYTTSVTIVATPTDGNYFVAWYDEDFNEISTDNPFTFTMPDYNVVYQAYFDAFSDLGPVEKGSTIQFGSYPQSKVTDATLLSTLNTGSGTLPTSANNQSWTSYGYYISGSVSSYMWYIDITNVTDEYRGVYFTSYRPFYTTSSSSTGSSYQDENGYTTSSVYWFKYEPITWRVLDVVSGQAFLMADLILDSQDYFYSTSDRTIESTTVYPNNYQESHIRSWLNDNFYNSAFTTEEKARVQTTTVDNSVASTGYSSNQYACANTSDKVFLLSYAEATSATYGLSTTTSRQIQPSAYAQSQGVYTDTSNGNSDWWLRSPIYSNAYNARYVYCDGFFDVSDVTYTNHGVVPALWISA